VRYRPTVLLLGALLASASWASEQADQPTPAPAPGVIPPPPVVPASGWGRWFDPATAPFIPVPLVGVDPDSGTTLGLIPTWVHTDANREINRIIAPDVLYNPYFGFGVHGRIYGYSSGDEQWSVTSGIKERVERDFDAEYQLGRLREGRWSFNSSVIYDRSGVPRFYGIGNETLLADQTNYTNQQERTQMQVGLNLNRAWQILYTGRLQVVDVLPGTLNKIPTIGTRFADVEGLGTNKLVLNRVSVVYDTRDDLVVPTSGMQLIAYGGLASRDGLLNDSMYSEAGEDSRAFWRLAPDAILVAHMALRYLPSLGNVPFWALSCVGGGDSVVGGTQPLRGFGAGRFCDRDSFSSSVEYRRKVMTVHASTPVDVEVTPFIDVGRVFAHGGLPVDQLHHVYGVGFRGIARPFVVGYVDIGYGSEGVAAFTGLNYPF
jgi:surface antigen Omp85-like protein